MSLFIDILVEKYKLQQTEKKKLKNQLNPSCPSTVIHGRQWEWTSHSNSMEVHYLYISEQVCYFTSSFHYFISYM